MIKEQPRCRYSTAAAHINFALSEVGQKSILQGPEISLS